MTSPQAQPCGSWPSPITSERIVSGTVGLGGVSLWQDAVLWLERRPGEGGRSCLVRRNADGRVEDLTPAPWNVRTRVHEYGGGAYTLGEDAIYFTNFADQRLHRLRPGEEPQALTEEGFRHADGVVDEARGLLFCIEEDHRASGEPVARVVSLAQDGSDRRQVIVEGKDFYAAPRLSPDGRRLAWLCWSHPDMPWDATELWVTHLAADGTPEISEQVAGGPDESVSEPRWSPDGVLHFVSDRSGWWNLYRWQEQRTEALCPRDAEFAHPHWVFGLSAYDFAGPGRIVCSYTANGRWHLALLDTTTGTLEELETPYVELNSLHANATHVTLVGASTRSLPEVARIELSSGEREVLRRAGSVEVDPGYLSEPESIAFPSAEGRTAYGLYYAPRSPACAAPAGERPPLLVLSHGGPTSATSAGLRLSIQFWTSRGIAVLDVNYGGSSGYGRAYRKLLEGTWGIVDVEDCAHGARFLVERGDVDGARLAIRGGSAGGYTTLCALTFTDAFHAGASHFGVSDLEALARDTHKFESRYLDRLIGPYPERRDLYQARSPIHHTERLSCPVILFQGLEDAVVPPNQAEMMKDALEAKGIPVAYLPFEGEQHGFRKAENIRRCLDAELYFYGRIFGFTPADAIEPVAIANLA